MENKENKPAVSLLFDRMAAVITKAAGKPSAFLIALFLIIAWAATGPAFHYSNTWQLIINTGTTIITFLMVFIIQQTQNKDTTALQLKLNELISSSREASNNLVGVEDLTERELEVLKKFYSRLAQMAKEEENIHTSHSLDEASAKHLEKNEITIKK